MVNMNKSDDADTGSNPAARSRYIPPALRALMNGAEQNSYIESIINREQANTRPSSREFTKSRPQTGFRSQRTFEPDRDSFKRECEIPREYSKTDRSMVNDSGSIGFARSSSYIGAGVSRDISRNFRGRGRGSDSNSFGDNNRGGWTKMGNFPNRDVGSTGVFSRGNTKNVFSSSSNGFRSSNSGFFGSNKKRNDDCYDTLRTGSFNRLDQIDSSNGKSELVGGLPFDCSLSGLRVDCFFLNQSENEKAGWGERDNRRYYKDVESDVFPSVNMSTGINFDSYDSIPVEVTGINTSFIRGITAFDDVFDAEFLASIRIDDNSPNAPYMRYVVDQIRNNCNDVQSILKGNMRKINYSRPTPIQRFSIPIILHGFDLMACAQTGSGKTAAFLFPIIIKLLCCAPPRLPVQRRFSHRYAPCFPVTLVLAPTRELAQQIHEESRKFCFSSGIRSVVVYGGNDVKNQIYELDKGCDILVATPGRLFDLLEKEKIKLYLVKFLVLDEADRMLDMGFAPQIRAVVDEYDMPKSEEGRQTIMFSATFPKIIQELARDFLVDYAYLTVGRVGSTSDFITQKVLYADENQKLAYLKRELKSIFNSSEKKGLVLIFVETKKGADNLEHELYTDYNVVCIHGNRSQPERYEALQLFKTGKRPIMVATDVAARGLDISNILHVINFDLPNHIDDYVHRIGRTGRAGNKGNAISFYNDRNKSILKDLVHLLSESAQNIPPWMMQYSDSSYDRRHDRPYEKRTSDNYSDYKNDNNHKHHGGYYRSDSSKIDFRRHDSGGRHIDNNRLESRCEYMHGSHRTVGIHPKNHDLVVTSTKDVRDDAW